MTEIKVGLGTCGISAGGYGVYDALKAVKKEKNLEVDLKETGCMGMGYREVLVEVSDDKGSWLYANVDEKGVRKIGEEHLKNGKPVEPSQSISFSSSHNSSADAFMVLLPFVLAL